MLIRNDEALLEFYADRLTDALSIAARCELMARRGLVEGRRASRLAELNGPAVPLVLEHGISSHFPAAPAPHETLVGSLVTREAQPGS